MVIMRLPCGTTPLDVVTIGSRVGNPADCSFYCIVAAFDMILRVTWRTSGTRPAATGGILSRGSSNGRMEQRQPL